MPNKETHKQAFFFTIINYVGILIGIVSTLFIYPKNKEMLMGYVEIYEQLIYDKPDYAEAYANLGNALRELNSEYNTGQYSRPERTYEPIKPGIRVSKSIY